MLPKICAEFKALIPPLSPEEREQLEQNIAETGECRDAIVLWNGVIIDGHNRFDICARHGISFGIRELNFENREAAMVWIIENQLGRRNLCDAARIELALQKAELLRERAKKNQIAAGRDKSRGGELLAKTSICRKEPIDVRKVLATEAGVGERTVGRYMQIKKDGHPELIEKMAGGEMKIGTAHRLLGKEIIKQLKVAEKSLRYIVKSIPYEGSDANCVIHEKLKKLACKARDLTEAGNRGEL